MVLVHPNNEGTLMVKKGSGLKTGAPRGLVPLFVLIVLSLSACAANKGVVKPGYPEELENWTRTVKVFEGFETRLYFSATYKSPSFRESYIDRYVEGYGLGETYRSALIERETEQGAGYNEFFFTAYTPVDEWNDFEKKESIWRLYLEDDTGARLAPVSITKLDSSDAVLREFFPYFDLWSSAYIVKFPKYAPAGAEPIPGPDTASMRLIVTGVIGKGQLEWRLK